MIVMRYTRYKPGSMTISFMRDTAVCLEVRSDN